MSLLSIPFAKKVNICKNNNSNYDGKFYLAVKSTKIFCLPSCSAKFPLLKNIIFYSSSDLALGDGFRPCKRCRPHTFPNNYPVWLTEVKKYFQENYSSKIDEKKLKSLTKVDMTTIRRYCKRYFGVNLKKYQLKLRLEHSLALLNKGESIDSISLKVGYQSSKSFKSSFKMYYGYVPRDYHEFKK